MLPIKDSPRRGQPTELTKARMLLVALAKLSFRLFALVQPVRQLFLTDGVWGGTDAVRLLSRQRVVPIT